MSEYLTNLAAMIHYRRLMREETNPKKKAAYLRAFREARNVVNEFKEGKK